MSRCKTRDGHPVDTLGMPSEKFPLANRKKPIQRVQQEVAEPVLDEVSVTEVRAGDTIRARLYQGMPGRVFAAQSRAGEDLLIVRIEDSTMPSNGYYRAYPIRVAMAADGRCFTLVSSDDCYVHGRHAQETALVAYVAFSRSTRPALPFPRPLALAASNEAQECEYEEP